MNILPAEKRCDFPDEGKPHLMVRVACFERFQNREQEDPEFCERRIRPVNVVQFCSITGICVLQTALALKQWLLDPKYLIFRP